MNFIPGWFSDKATDAFSVGCLIALLTTGRPLFVKSPPGPTYLKEMLYQYNTVLGPFPRHYVHKLRHVDELVFIGSSESDCDIEPIGSPLSPAVGIFTGDLRRLAVGMLAAWVIGILLIGLF